MNTVMSLYCLLLHLYPASFRESIGDEMQSTFADLMHERQAQGQSSVLWAVVRETTTLPLLALHERIDERLSQMHATTDTTNAVPRLLRAAGIITTLFLMVCSLIVWLLFLAAPLGAHVSKLVLMIAVFHTVMLVSFFAAFRFPHYGSVVVLTSAVTLAVIQLQLLSGLGVGSASALMIGLWAAPYLILGIAIRLQQHRHAFAG